MQIDTGSTYYCPFIYFFGSQLATTSAKCMEMYVHAIIDVNQIIYIEIGIGHAPANVE